MDIIKAFNDNHMHTPITILGTPNDPLFRASDIGVVLGLSNINATISNFDDTERTSTSMKTQGGEQTVMFLTELGLYRILFVCRKPIAIIFKKWVCEVIKEIPINGSYELQKTNQELETKNQELKDDLEKAQNDQEFRSIALSTTTYIYIYNLDTTIVAPAIPKLKIGYSMCLQKRARPFNIICPNGKITFSQEVKYLNDIADPVIKEKELRKLETSVHSKLSHLFHADKEVFHVDIEEAKFCIVNEY